MGGGGGGNSWTSPQRTPSQGFALKKIFNGTGRVQYVSQTRRRLCAVCEHFLQHLQHCASLWLIHGRVTGAPGADPPHPSPLVPAPASIHPRVGLPPDVRASLQSLPTGCPLFRHPFCRNAQPGMIFPTWVSKTSMSCVHFLSSLLHNRMGPECGFMLGSKTMLYTPPLSIPSGGGGGRHLARKA